MIQPQGVELAAEAGAAATVVVEPSVDAEVVVGAVDVGGSVVVAGSVVVVGAVVVVALTEIVPMHVRTAGFSVAYSLATAVFGGSTPAIVTYLIEATGNRAVAGVWLMFAALCALVATLLAYRTGAAATAGAAAKSIESAR